MPIKYEQADKCFEQSSEQFLDRKIRSSTCGQTLALHAFLRRTAELEPGKLDASKLRITLTTTPCEVPGRNSADVWSMNNCTDHMVTARWTVDRGWEAPEIRPVEPLPILPTASCLHYATQCFEGLKVYRGVDKKLRLFRPDCNCERLIMSSKRISLPQPDAAAVEKLILELIKVDGKRR
jgi:branched-chain amino acid aminotransferase